MVCLEGEKKEPIRVRTLVLKYSLKNKKKKKCVI
jgi:hypothetical protein